MTQDSHSRAAAPYDRAHPSPRYSALLQFYREMHQGGDGQLAPEETFNGRSLAPHTATIRDLIARHGARTLLDYGAGKGVMYGMRDLRDAEGNVHPDMRSYWNLSAISLYDPGYAPHGAYPAGRFDAVICTDVLEHVPAEDVPWVIGEIAGFAEKFLFVTIAGYPAQKILPNGENAHCTLCPAEWWIERLNTARDAVGRPNLRWYALYIDRDPANGKMRHRSLKG